MCSDKNGALSFSSYLEKGHDFFCTYLIDRIVAVHEIRTINKRVVNERSHQSLFTVL